MERSRLALLLWIPLLGYLCYLLYRLAWFDGITSVANDSVNYLVMARHYSPWAAESEAIRQAWPLQDFPPLFPLLLAFTGAAHSLLSAHIMAVVLGLTGLYLVYRIGVGVSGNRVLANAATLLVAISPGYILGLQGILSESLYMLLSLAFIYQYSKLDRSSNLQLVLVGILLAAAMLTRTVGFVLLIALLCHGVLAAVAGKCVPATQLKLGATGLLIYVVSMLVFGPEKQSHYFGAFTGFLSGEDPTDIGGGWAVLASQVQSILDAWRTFFLIYWLDDYGVTSVLTTVLFGLSLVGLYVRLRKNRLDAWYGLGYLLLLLLWPHPGQMVRLLFPIVPVLLIYAGVALQLLFINMQSSNIYSMAFFALLYVLVLPAHAFIHGRLEMADAMDMVPVYEAFRKPDADMARREIALQNKMIDSFGQIKKHVADGGRVMYFVPAYLAVLGDRTGIGVPYPVNSSVYTRIARDTNSNYLFLTELHPRKTREGFSGFSGAKSIEGWVEGLWCNQLDSGEKVACLYRFSD